MSGRELRTVAGLTDRHLVDGTTHLLVLTIVVIRILSSAHSAQDTLAECWW